MKPSEAMAALNDGVSPVDYEQIRRADPTWTRPVDDDVAAPEKGVWL